MLKISIITPIYNGATFIKKYINSLVDSLDNSTDNILVECLFVDNNSNDNTVQLIKHMFKKVIKPINLKYLVLSYNDKASSYGSRNFGVRHSNFDHLLFTDIDCVYPLNFFKKFSYRIKYLNLKDYALAGNIKLQVNDTNNVFEQYDKAFGFNMKRYVRQKTGVTACAAFNKKLFNNNNGFDEFESGADRLFFKKIEKENKKSVFIYDEDIVIHHPCRSSKKEIISKIERVSRGLCNIYLRKNILLKVVFFLKNFIGIIFQFHQLRVIAKTLSSANKFCFKLKIKFILYSLFFGGYARAYICKNLIFNK